MSAISPPRTEGKEQQAEIETAPTFDPDLEPAGHQARDILPECWPYDGSRRPDGLAIENMTPQGTQSTTHGKPDGEYYARFFDPTFTSEASIIAANNKKYEQYAVFMDSRPMGAETIPLPFGVRGFIPHHTRANLKRLKIKGNALKELERIISRTAILYVSKILMTRRRLEHDLPDALSKSGLVRYEYFRKRKAALMKQYGTT